MLQKTSHLVTLYKIYVWNTLPFLALILDKVNKLNFPRQSTYLRLLILFKFLGKFYYSYCIEVQKTIDLSGAIIHSIISKVTPFIFVIFILLNGGEFSWPFYYSTGMTRPPGRHKQLFRPLVSFDSQEQFVPSYMKFV